MRRTVRPGAWADRPVVVIIPSGGPSAPAQRLAALSTRGRLLVAPTTDHYVHAARPDLVIAAIRDVAASS
ncbi:pimeloyl-ACP methyl ester carboxylesterase [Thermocatellispora tengchongensis]|uniref:Pimeloyl-ACP methyl ester carboxylesterase n=1 Tax=Thermocatellispora tengchongensis TaxID=1073253 RepID=A0A840PCE5_9ACTN|nr:hypothetical protein [Thermocatellispora tengchongensis]MBB5136912.1 pimeloyl-ACP methyl ester carboxylesterase [Thermocatellispora tengchongensis]